MSRPWRLIEAPSARRAVSCALVAAVVLACVDALPPPQPLIAASRRVAVAAPVDWRVEVAPAILVAVSRPPDGRDTAARLNEAAALAMFYVPERGRAAWIDAAGAPTAEAREALALLSGAADEGLVPGDYDAASMAALAAAIDAGSPDRERLADFDRRLSAAVLRYLRHLHHGRLDPRTLGVALDEAPERHDVAGMLREALAAHRLRALVEQLTPSLPQYAALRRQLARYRRLQMPGMPPAPQRSLHRGEPFAAAPLLRACLLAFGDLDAAAAPPLDAATYDDALAAAVQRFQARHGLAADGVFGRATVEALSVPIQLRIRQIELALERLRWLPDLGGERVIALNIPMFRLSTWDGAGTTQPALRMRAIVGRALVTQTPVFSAMMRAVVFRPYWHVPRSILLGEILPALERDPGQLQRLDLEIVDGERDEARTVPLTPETLARLRQGTLRIRQRPGPGNSLGLVKFDFPNAAGVYMHGTPAVGLFARSRRDFSHGCVRVEDPAALAEWVLRDDGTWDRTRIDAAMHAATSTRVALSTPIRVVLFYTTAAVAADDATVHFADDIYGHDARLAAALARVPLEPTHNGLPRPGPSGGAE
jgi:murein L,D-transpeptidase YcbB/YkuD